jgi:hypothetical protein
MIDLTVPIGALTPHYGTFIIAASFFRFAFAVSGLFPGCWCYFFSHFICGPLQK